MKLILLGPPGAGKGTQAKLLEAEFGVPQISTGDLLRQEVAAGSEIGKAAGAVMAAGGLVPDELLLRLLARRLGGAALRLGFILDGFPRNLSQARALDSWLDARDAQIDAVLELKVDDAALVDRIAGRFACAACGAGYHETLKPPRAAGHCDRCAGTRFTRREDDRAEVVAARLAAYAAQTAPLLPYYRAQARLFSVDGMAPPDQVFQDIRMLLDAIRRPRLERADSKARLEV
ncbi:MAG: adenylate kinase [Rhodospirillales bacterium 20-64-7]|nr:MAG: adenylate kinase [Rhodospirillales bacterium 20-64-7]